MTYAEDVTRFDLDFGGYLVLNGDKNMLIEYWRYFRHQTLSSDLSQEPKLTLSQESEGIYKMTKILDVFLETSLISLNFGQNGSTLSLQKSVIYLCLKKEERTHLTS